jgi:peptidoglycan/xylan/chitin deacetylase (PgdA/CDA1 family)
MPHGLSIFGRRSLKSSTAPFARILRAGQRQFKQRTSSSTDVMILGYHRVVADAAQAERDAIYGLVTSAATLERHLELAREVYDVLPLDEAVKVVRGERKAVRPVAAITFDDGYRDLYDEALPVLKRLGMPATVFVPTAYMGTNNLLDHDRIYWLALRAQERAIDLSAPLKRAGLAPEKVSAICADARPLSLAEHIVYLPSEIRERIMRNLEDALGGDLGRPSGTELLTWEMIAEMTQAGISFGSHTDRHPVLTLETEAEIERELLRSKRTLEERLNRPARHFAYPNGRHSAAIKRLLARLGFEMAVTTERRINQSGDDLFSLGRVCLCEESTRGVLGQYSSSVARLRLAM